MDLFPRESCNNNCLAWRGERSKELLSGGNLSHKSPQIVTLSHSCKTNTMVEVSNNKKKCNPHPHPRKVVGYKVEMSLSVNS